MEPDLHLTAAGRLRTVGRRYTANRRALVEILARAGQPLTLPDILGGGPNLAQSSAYRNLAALEQAGMVRRVVTNEEFGRYELAEDLTEHHHHLVCSNCGTVEDVTIPTRLERSMERALEQVAARTGFATVSHRLDLVGHCRSCS